MKTPPGNAQSEQREDSVWYCTIRNSTKTMQGYNQNSIMMMMLGLVSSDVGLTYYGQKQREDIARL